MSYLPPWSNACACATQGLLGERQTLLARIAEDTIKNRPLCLVSSTHLLSGAQVMDDRRRTSSGARGTIVDVVLNWGATLLSA